MTKSTSLSESSVGREGLQQFLGFLLWEQLQDELLFGSSSGRSLLPLMFCSSFIYLFILFPLCLKLYRNTVHVCHTTPALYVASIVYCPVCVCVRCRTSLAWTGWCSIDGRRWRRAAALGLRRQITTKLMVWTSAAQKQQLWMIRLDLNTVITRNSVRQYVFHQSVSFSTWPRPFLWNPDCAEVYTTCQLKRRICVALLDLHDNILKNILETLELWC